MSDYRFVSLSYPGDYWAEHGPEIIETANEVHGDAWSFRESRHLLATGLRTRSLDATGGSIRQTWISGLAIAVFLVLLVGASLSLLELLGFEEFAVVAEPPLAKIGAIVAVIAMSHSTRWPSMAFALATFGAASTLSEPRLDNVIFFLVIAVAVGLVAFAGTGRRVISPTALAVLLAVIVASARWGFFLGSGPFLLSLVVTGIALVWLDPRFAAAVSIYCLFVAISMIALTADLANETDAPLNGWLGIPIPFIVAGIASIVAISLATGVSMSVRRMARC